MTDWATIATAATAVGTLVLAAATFSSVRSANMAARVAERSLQVGLRPLLLPSRFEDPVVKVNFLDEHLMHARGGMGAVDEADGNFYMIMSVRNAGSGLAILHGWFLPEEPEDRAEWASTMTPPEPELFRRLNRDIYVAGNDVGFWQGALRDPQDPCYATVRKALEDRTPLMVDLLYGDQDGGQRTISRFRLTARQEGPERLASVARHWFLDRADPR
ncbi:MAG TPA: hypothetical protein VGL32_03535 [Acidimicrobiales bacterium]